MESGYKNREVLHQRYESALNLLTHEERNEYRRDGNITVSPNNVYPEREVCELMTTRRAVKNLKLEDILHAEYYTVDTASDGTPFTFFLNFDYGLIRITRFSDNTMLVFCKNKKYFKFLQQREGRKYKIDVLNDNARLDLNKVNTKKSNQ